MMDCSGRSQPDVFSLVLDEPVPLYRKMKVSDTPGFGVCLNPECKLKRRYCHP
jgi:L-rhamnonate dehydratase